MDLIAARDTRQGYNVFMLWPSRDVIHHTMIHNWIRFPLRALLPEEPEHPVCGFMTVYVAGFRDDPLYVPCSLCVVGEDSSYDAYHQRIKELLQSHYRTISDDYAQEVVSTFQPLVDHVNTTFNCLLHCPDARTTTANFVKIEVQPLLAQHLLNLITDTFPNGAPRIDEECAVCMEMMTESSMRTLTMPCSHTFHQHCLTRWLNRTRSCPMRRRLIDSEEIS